jgi:hypothetical protein
MRRLKHRILVMHRPDATSLRASRGFGRFARPL